MHGSIPASARTSSRVGIALVFAIAMSVTAAPAWAAPAFVKVIGTNSDGTSSNTTIPVTVPAAGVAAGNTVIVELAMDSSNVTVSCADSRGNSYTNDADVTNSNSGSARAVIFSATVGTALVSGDAITVTFSGQVAPKAISALEFSGLVSGSGRLDKTASGANNGTSMTTASTTTTSQADELLIGAFAVRLKSVSFTAGSNYTGAGGVTMNLSPASNNVAAFPEYRIVSATGAYLANGSNGGSTSTDWAALITTYKAVVATPTPTATVTATPTVTATGSATCGA